jgi:hypothetical protein
MPITNCININHQGCKSRCWIIIGNSSDIKHHYLRQTFRGIPLILHFICQISYPTLVLQQQMGTSASIPDVQARQPTSADAPQPAIAEAQAKGKALTDAEAQQKRQKSMPIPTSAPTSASQPVNVAEQVNPPV